MNYVQSSLRTDAGPVDDISVAVYRVHVRDMEAWVCISDYCIDAQYLSRDFATTRPICYVHVYPRRDEITRADCQVSVSLADMLSGTVDLSWTVKTLAEKGPIPSKVSLLTVKKHIVECDRRGVRINGRKVVSPQRKENPLMLLAFQSLYSTFCEDLMARKSPDEYRWMTTREISDDVYKRAVDEKIPLETLKDKRDKRATEPGSEIDYVQRILRHLRATIMKAIKGTVDFPVGEDDVIECRSSGSPIRRQYRINPALILVAPSAANCPR